MQYIVMDRNLTVTEQHVYSILVKSTFYDHVETSISIEKIIKESDKRLELTERKVRTVIKKLVESKHIEIIRAGSRSKPTTYRITRGYIYNYD